MDISKLFKNGQLRLPANMSKDTWESVGESLLVMRVNHRWCLGDWILFGLGKFRITLNSEARRLGLSLNTLSSYKSVAARFSPDMRTFKLSWSHYLTVVAVDDVSRRMALLKQAEKRGLSRDDLRDLEAGHSTLLEYAVHLRWADPITPKIQEQLHKLVAGSGGRIVHAKMVRSIRGKGVAGRR